MDYKLERNTITNQWDKVIKNGDFVLIDGVDEIVQRCIINLSTFYGEFFPASEAGTDYFKNVYPYDYQDQVLQGEFKRVINSTRGVTGIDNIEFSLVNETLFVKPTITTTSGETATFTFSQ